MIIITSLQHLFADSRVPNSIVQMDKLTLYGVRTDKYHSDFLNDYNYYIYCLHIIQYDRMNDINLLCCIYELIIDYSFIRHKSHTTNDKSMTTNNRE